MLAATLPLVSSGLQIGGTIASMFGGGNKGAQELANRNYELSVRQMQNQAALIAEAMKRSTAGTSDSEGNSTSYDPGSNTWSSKLGPGAERVQRSSDNATTLRNTIDLPNAQRANRQEHLLSAIAKRNAIPAQTELANFRPRTGEREFADMSTMAARANNDATRPILQDTLRSFARTGTSAGPVIDAMGRSSADSLRKGIMEARTAANAGAASNNQSMIAALASRLGALQSGGRAQMDYVNPVVQNPNAAQTAGMAQRASSAGDITGRGAAYSAYGQNGANSAMEQLLRQQSPNALPMALMTASKQVNPLVDAIRNLMNPGTSGDARSVSNPFANINFASMLGGH